MEISNPLYYQFETNKADWATNFWLDSVEWMRRLGVRSSHFDTHPRADDVVTLLLIRQSLWPVMAPRERAVWAGYWSIVFKKQLPIKDKFWRKFQKIANNIDRRHNRQQHKNPQNKDHDNEAKGSDLAQMLTNKSNNRGATMNLLPWE